MATATLIQPQAIGTLTDTVIIDCRFSLQDSNAGREQYEAGHIPSAHYLDLNLDLSAPACEHGGRHPLPAANTFAAKLAALGIGPDTHVVAYDDSRLAYAARLWWMMGSLGFKPPVLLDGGYQAWLKLGVQPQRETPTAKACPVKVGRQFAGHYDIAAVREAMAGGATLIDSREAARYQGLIEPIDPVAGHIPGAHNKPWQAITDEQGRAISVERQRQNMAELLDAAEIVVYCGSGVTACVNLFALAMLGREDAILYGGSWSDWCSYLPKD